MAPRRLTPVSALLIALPVAACAPLVATPRSEAPVSATPTTRMTHPPVTPSPTASLPATPDPTPSPSPPPSPLAEPATFSITIDGEGRRRVIEVRDYTGSVLEARQAIGEEIEVMGLREAQIWAAPLTGDPASVYVRWDGGVCDLAYELDVTPSTPQVVVREADRNACDAAGWSTAIVLTFDRPVDAERFVPELIEGRVFPRS